MDARRRKLFFRATHRGFKEMDMMMGEFAEVNLEKMDDAGLEEFERLLDSPDQDVYGWIIGRETEPDAFKGPVMEMLKAFDLPAHMKAKGLL
ncbi:succinate dehydrogenase assembly factor 2 [Hirschia litorea]|uniref:FAD assembly factor SdhE n=1 Tax=Hirschia litorea TaxID=1199156 RepID=A0ABW2IHP8_9PROT